LATDEGYELDKATFSGRGTVTDNEDGTLTLGGVTSAGQLSVAFKLKQYEITTSTSIGGGISPASVTLAHGSSQIFTLAIDEGYELDEAIFSGGGTVVDNSDGTLTLAEVTSAGELSVEFIIVSGIQVTKNNAFTIYPNPTSGVIKTIGINSPYYHYTIHDLSGALMLRGNLSEEGNIDISKLKNGVYILTLKFLEIEESIKIIKN
ncbi:MAG: T9SS type A sorting domain-containing protein, partial [Bacteroidales bacterium]|nr:T9SS type A sorting domain-containing protein [Bacteroidales bacterium]